MSAFESDSSATTSAYSWASNGEAIDYEFPNVGFGNPIMPPMPSMPSLSDSFFSQRKERASLEVDPVITVSHETIAPPVAQGRTF